MKAGSVCSAQADRDMLKIQMGHPQGWESGLPPLLCVSKEQFKNNESDSRFVKHGDDC